jgi:hypothetical protein
MPAKYLVDETSKSPYISLDRGLFDFSGRSIPEDARAFFKPVIDWIKAYDPAGEHKTTVNFSFEYLNTSSSKCVFDMLKAMNELYEKGNDLIINWYYEEGDEDMLDLGVHLKSFNKVPFNLIEKAAVKGEFDDFKHKD